MLLPRRFNVGAQRLPCRIVVGMGFRRGLQQFQNLLPFLVILGLFALGQKEGQQVRRVRVGIQTELGQTFLQKFRQGVVFFIIICHFSFFGFSFGSKDDETQQQREIRRRGVVGDRRWSCVISFKT